MFSLFTHFIVTFIDKWPRQKGIARMHAWRGSICIKTILTRGWLRDKWPSSSSSFEASSFFLSGPAEFPMATRFYWLIIASQYLGCGGNCYVFLLQNMFLHHHLLLWQTNKLFSYNSNPCSCKWKEIFYTTSHFEQDEPKLYLKLIYEFIQI